ncbi:MAG: hypothetical protein FJW24_06030 [Acidimicrobiia bacterium]|nr:hypothetical protein [Acidimicrobiia bacterium]
MTPAARAEAFVLSLVLAGCAAPRAGIDIEGKLDVLGPTPDLVAAGLPGDWVSEGKVTPGQARVVEIDGVPALRLVPGDRGFLLARRIDAPAFMTPDLSWSWNMDFHGEGLHPVRLVVGFQGGAKGAGFASAPVGGAEPCSNPKRPSRARRSTSRAAGARTPASGGSRRWICNGSIAICGPATTPCACVSSL